MGPTDNDALNRRDFVKGSLGLLVFSTVGGSRLFGRIYPASYRLLPGNMVSATYMLKASDYPTFESKGVKYGLTEIGSAIKIGDEGSIEGRTLLAMNPDQCKHGAGGGFYPISVVRIKQNGEDAFSAVSTWCPHNNDSQLDDFEHRLGKSGLFVCRRHQFSCFTADGTWVPPELSPYPDAPPKEEFQIETHLNPDGTPHLRRFRTTYDESADTLTIHDILCECEPCPPSSAPEDSLPEYELHPNYPNPVRHTTIIRFTLPGPSHARLTIVSPGGEEIAVVLDRRMEAGVHSVDFKATDLPSGSYFYKLETAFGTRTRKMTVVR